MTLTKRDTIVQLFPQVGDTQELQTVYEETGVTSYKSMKTWLWMIRRDFGISLHIRGEYMVREK